MPNHKDKDDKVDTPDLVGEDDKPKSKEEKRAERKAKKAKKAADARVFGLEQGRRDIDDMLELSTYSAEKQAEIEKRIRKEAGDPSLAERALIGLTGGIAGIVGGGYKRSKLADKRVELFRDEVKFRRALMGAKTERAVSSGMSAADKGNVHTVLSELHALKREGYIDKNDMVPQIRDPNVRNLWWSGHEFREGEPVMKQLRGHIKKASKGNEVSTRFLGGVAATLKRHRANFEWGIEQREKERIRLAGVEESQAAAKLASERAAEAALLAFQRSEDSKLEAFKRSQTALRGKEARDRAWTLYYEGRAEREARFMAVWRQKQANLKEQRATREAKLKEQRDAVAAAKEKAQSRHDAAMKEQRANEEKFDLSRGQKMVNEYGEFVLPEEDREAYTNEDGSLNRRGMNLMRGAMDFYATQVGAPLLKQLAVNREATQGAYTKLMHNFGVYDFDSKEWWDSLPVASKAMVTGEKFLGEIAKFSQGVADYSHYYGTHPSSIANNPYQKMFGHQKALAALQGALRKVDKNSPQAQRIIAQIKKVRGDLGEAQNEADTMTAFIAKKNADFLDMEKRSRDDAQDNARAQRDIENARKEATRKSSVADVKAFREIVHAADDEDRELYDAMFFEKDEDGTLRVKDVFRPLLHTFTSSVPTGIDARLIDNPKLVSGIYSVRSVLYTPKGGRVLTDEELKAGKEILIPTMERNGDILSEEMKREMTKARRAYRAKHSAPAGGIGPAAPTGLEYHPEIIYDNFDDVISSQEQMQMIADMVASRGKLPANFKSGGLNGSQWLQLSQDILAAIAAGDRAKQKTLIKLATEKYWD